MKNPDLAIVTGFGDKGIDKLEHELVQQLEPHSSTVIPSAPWYRAMEHPETVIEQVTEAVDKISGDNLLLLGHSYGALIALVVACRRKLENILQLILIDGPLGPDHDVVPAKSLHKPFFRHYEYRPTLALECQKALQSLDTSRVFTISSRHDKIVPPGSKLLQGDFDLVYLEGDEEIETLRMNGNGANIVLPGNYAGHGLENRIKPVARIIERVVRT